MLGWLSGDWWPVVVVWLVWGVPSPQCSAQVGTSSVSAQLWSGSQTGHMCPHHTHQQPCEDTQHQTQSNLSWETGGKITVSRIHYSLKEARNQWCSFLVRKYSDTIIMLWPLSSSERTVWPAEMTGWDQQPGHHPGHQRTIGPCEDRAASVMIDYGHPPDTMLTRSVEISLQLVKIWVPFSCSLELALSGRLPNSLNYDDKENCQASIHCVSCDRRHSNLKIASFNDVHCLESCFTSCEDCD